MKGTTFARRRRGRWLVALSSLLAALLLVLGLAGAAGAAGRASFPDVPEGSWYAPWVAKASAARLMTGYDAGPKAGTFGPEDALTRAQVATVLWRMAGTPEPGTSPGFPDVERGSWYAKAVDWCAEAGVVTGYEDGPDKGKFVPDGEVTRAELAAMAWRWAKWAGVDVTCPDPSAFQAAADSQSVEGWAVEAMTWTAAAGVLTGVDNPDGTRSLEPASGATRAQAAKVFVVLSGKPLAPKASHTVTFEANGGSAVAPQSVTCGEAVARPADPAREGHAFSGWFSDKDLTKAYDFKTPVTADVTLYAGWDLNTYTVTFNANGGSEVAAQTVSYGGKATAPEPPSKAGHTFSGWYSDEALKQAYDFENTPATANITMYAKWQANVYYVIFKSNGGSKVKTQAVFYNRKAREPTAPTRTDYTFAGWFSDASLKTPYVFADTPVTTDIFLYAKWNEIPIYAVLYYDGALYLQRGDAVDTEKYSDSDVVEKWLWDRSSSPWAAKYYNEIASIVVRDKISLSGDCTGLFSYRVLNTASNKEEWLGLPICRSMDLGKLDVSGVESFASMFRGCSGLATLNLSGWNPSSAYNLYYMFDGCSSLKSLDLSGWNVSRVTNFYAMFYQCSRLETLAITGWTPSSATNLSQMFSGCSALKSLDLSGWNPSSVKDLSTMFGNCASLTSLDLSGWNVGSATNLSAMFLGCSALKSLDLSDWNVSKVTNLSNMFLGCSSLKSLSLSGWSPSATANTTYMFIGCNSIDEVTLGAGCAQIAALLGGPWYGADGTVCASIPADALPGTFTTTDPVAQAGQDTMALAASGADVTFDDVALGEEDGLTFEDVEGTAESGAADAAASGEGAGADQATDAAVPADGDQAADSDAAAGADQAVDFDAPADDGQAADTGAAGNDQAVDSDVPADFQPAAAEQGTGGASADGASYAPADQPAEQTDALAAPEFADLAGEETFDLAA